MIKSCVNCKHCVDYETALALNPNLATGFKHYCIGDIDPVTGAPRPAGPASYLRTIHSVCGVKGLLFEVKS